MTEQTALNGEQIVALVEHLPALILSVVSLLAALRAGKRAADARDCAINARETAAEAAREQIHFALRAAARQQKEQKDPKAEREKEVEHE